MTRPHYPFHTMLPRHLQGWLMAASVYPCEGATLKDLETLDAVIRDVQTQAPQKFHDAGTLTLRRFHHEPRQSIAMAGFEVPLPPGVHRH